MGPFLKGMGMEGISARRPIPTELLTRSTWNTVSPVVQISAEANGKKTLNPLFFCVARPEGSGCIPHT